MNRSLIPVVLAVTCGGLLRAENLPGEWSPPPDQGGSVLHEPTGLAFPPKIADYELVGIFDYSTEEGMFVRYTSQQARSRADVFLFPTAEKSMPLEAKQRAIMSEIDAVILKLGDMAKAGQYKDIEVGELKVGEIQLWQADALPLGSREVTATRIGQLENGVKEAEIVQWIGSTVYNDCILTIRHIRPAVTGDAGKASLDAFVTGVVQVIRDPSVRREVRDRLKAYAADPLGPSAVEHTLMTLAYLNESQTIKTLVPAPPLTTWLEACEKALPGSGDLLEHAFVMGNARRILEEPAASLDDRLESACAQLIDVYQLLKQKNGAIQQPKLEELAAEVGVKRAAGWLKRQTSGA